VRSTAVRSAAVRTGRRDRLIAISGAPPRDRPYDFFRITPSASSCPQSPVRSPLSAVPCPQSPVRSPLSAVPCPQSPVRSPPSAVPYPQYPIRSTLSAVPYPQYPIRITPPPCPQSINRIPKPSRRRRPTRPPPIPFNIYLALYLMLQAIDLLRVREAIRCIRAADAAVVTE
jgi:hypothetical protein